MFGFFCFYLKLFWLVVLFDANRVPFEENSINLSAISE